MQLDDGEIGKGMDNENDGVDGCVVRCWGYFTHHSSVLQRGKLSHDLDDCILHDSELAPEYLTARLSGV